MLANGAKLGYSATNTSPVTYTDLTGLKELPEIGVDPEKIENTCLSDTVKQYEYGIGDPGDLEFKFKYDNSGATKPYRVMRGYADSKATVYFQLELSDGTKFTWAAQVNVKVGSGSVNGVMEFTLSMALQSAIDVVDPS